MYSQSNEDEFVLKYFGKYKGTLLDIGANDGLTFSNSKLLIEKGWFAHLVEPSGVFYDLKRLHNDNDRVSCYNVAIGEEEGIMDFYESGCHVPNGTDKALVSTLDFNETQRWSGVKFNAIKVSVIPFKFLWEMTVYTQLDFISIDAEAKDWEILQQMDLNEVGCTCLCIEWNGDERLKFIYTKHCEKFGLKQALINGENIIFTK